MGHLDVINLKEKAPDGLRGLLKFTCEELIAETHHTAD
jgi:hypothetical protein